MADIMDGYDLGALKDVSGGFDPLPPGVYPVRIESVEFGQTNNNNDKITLTCVVIGGDFEGRKIWHKLIQTDKAMWVTKRTLECLGVTKEDFNEGKSISWYDFVGSELGLMVTVNEEYGSNDVKKILSIDRVPTYDAGPSF